MSINSKVLYYIIGLWNFKRTTCTHLVCFASKSIIATSFIRLLIILWSLGMYTYPNQNVLVGTLYWFLVLYKKLPRCHKWDTTEWQALHRSQNMPSPLRESFLKPLHWLWQKGAWLQFLQKVCRGGQCTEKCMPEGEYVLEWERSSPPQIVSSFLNT